MNETKDSGYALQQPASNPSAINSTESSKELRAWVAGETQVLREMIPGPLLSDAAAKLMLDMLVELAEEIGQERFHATILAAIKTCERRPGVATLRRLAGVNPRMDVTQEAVVEAWERVTKTVTGYLGYDAHGNCRPTHKVVQNSALSLAESVPPPILPASVTRAVQSLGGWKALAESYPEWWSQKFTQFKDVLRLYPEDVRSLTSNLPRLSAPE